MRKELGRVKLLWGGRARAAGRGHADPFLSRITWQGRPWNQRSEERESDPCPALFQDDACGEYGRELGSHNERFCKGGGPSLFRACLLPRAACVHTEERFLFNTGRG